VLLVDDEDTLVSALKRSLARTCDVVATTSAAEALVLLLAGEVFDVVLCDMIMPSVSGIDVYERVKAVRPELARRFVFMTGGAFTPRMRKFLDASTNPRLDKPFSAAQLRRAIEKLDEAT
jgi:CheY-like chemotaxis protein